MRCILFLAAAAALSASAAAPKPLPGQAGNDDIDLSGSVLVERSEIEQALGVDLGAGYLVVRMKAVPKTDKPLRIGPDDFTMVSRKDGQRSQALTPNEIAGNGGTLIVRSSDQRGGNGSRRTVSIGGLGGGAVGSSPGTNTNVDAHVEQNNEKPDAKTPAPACAEGKRTPGQGNKRTAGRTSLLSDRGENQTEGRGDHLQRTAGKLVIDFQNPKRER